MGWINELSVSLICVSLLMACAPKKEGADTHVWSVTAQNGDKVVGCLAEDVTPDVVGYIDIEALPNFDIATFENMEVGLDQHLKTGEHKVYLTEWSGGGHPAGLKWKREDKIKHCESYPPPKGASEWYFSQQISGISVQYRLFSLGDKMVFIDARTRE